MSTVDDLDQILYEQLLDYESAVTNAALRFEDQALEGVRRKLYRADGRLRYWVFVYIVAIDLFSPDPLDFERESSCQAEILRHCGNCGQPELLELFPKAKNSAWRAIVLMAERELTGEPNPEALPIERKYGDLEVGLIALNLKIDSSWDIAVARLNKFINFDEENVDERIAKLTKLKKQKRKSSKKDHFLQCVILSLWVHPDFPLWLMQVKPGLKMAGMVGEMWGVGGSIGRSAYEQAKNRLADNDGLVKISIAQIQTAPIRDIVIAHSEDKTEVPIIRCMEFNKKFSPCIPRVAEQKFYGGIRCRNPMEISD